MGFQTFNFPNLLLTKLSICSPSSLNPPYAILTILDTNANKANHHPGIVRLQEFGERLLTRYLWGDENGNAIVPTFTEIEAIRKSYETMVTTYNHQLQEEYGYNFHEQSIKTLTFIVKHVEPIMYETMLSICGDPSYKSDWFTYHKTFKRNPYVHATVYLKNRV